VRLKKKKILKKKKGRWKQFTLLLIHKAFANRTLPPFRIPHQAGVLNNDRISIITIKEAESPTHHRHHQATKKVQEKPEVWTKEKNRKK
jgi:hypothetical protein